MNERIKQLAEQATAYANEQNELHGVGYVTTFKEKFAQLIVQECAGVGYDASYYECALDVSNKIKQHFGVEE